MRGKVTLNTKLGSFSAGFVFQAIRLAPDSGLTDAGSDHAGMFRMTLSTPRGPLVAYPTDEPDTYPGFYLDRVVCKWNATHSGAVLSIPFMLYGDQVGSLPLRYCIGVCFVCSPNTLCI